MVMSHKENHENYLKIIGDIRYFHLQVSVIVRFKTIDDSLDSGI